MLSLSGQAPASGSLPNPFPSYLFNYCTWVRGYHFQDGNYQECSSCDCLKVWHNLCFFQAPCSQPCFCRAVHKICSLVTTALPAPYHLAPAILHLIPFSTYFSSSFRPTDIFQVDSELFKHLSFKKKKNNNTFSAPFLLGFVCFFPLLMEGYKKGMAFQLSESLVPCASFFSWNIGKSTFLCCLSVSSECLLAALIFSLKASASSPCLYLVASRLSVPPWPTMLWHRLLVLRQLLQPQENCCPCPPQERVFLVFYHISPHYHIPIHHFTCSLSSRAKLLALSWLLLCSVNPLCWNPARLLDISFIWPCLFYYTMTRFFLFLSLTFCFYNAVYHVLLTGCHPNYRN